jgi:hypothetical protein
MDMKYISFSIDLLILIIITNKKFSIAQQQITNANYLISKTVPYGTISETVFIVI